MIRKYLNHKLQTNPWHHEVEPRNNHETPGRQTKQSYQLSILNRDDCKTIMDTKVGTTKHRTTHVQQQLILNAIVCSLLHHGSISTPQCVQVVT